MIVNVGNINLYYEISGQQNNRPLILLHGNGEDHTIFEKLIKYIEKDFKVYAVDSRGHGRSDAVEEYHYDDMAEDIKHFIRKLNIEKPILVGFSDGGIVGLMLAYKYQTLLSKAVICGANLSPDGLKESVLKAMKREYKEHKDSKMKMMTEEPNIKEADLKKIKIPILLTAGEKDIFKDAHTEYIHGNIKNSKIQIFTGENHESYILNPKNLYECIHDFILSL